MQWANRVPAKVGKAATDTRIRQAQALDFVRSRLGIRISAGTRADSCVRLASCASDARAGEGRPDGERVGGEACKRPVSRVLSRARRPLYGHSSGPPVARGFSRSTTEGRAQTPGAACAAPLPIRPCTRRGLPCRLRCRRRGGLLPHRFTLAVPQDGGLFSVALSLGLGARAPPPAGRYPAPCLRGARTFLSPPKGAATVRPLARGAV